MRHWLSWLYYLIGEPAIWFRRNEAGELVIGGRWWPTHLLWRWRRQLNPGRFYRCRACGRLWHTDWVGSCYTSERGQLVGLCRKHREEPLDTAG